MLKKCDLTAYVIESVCEKMNLSDFEKVINL